MMKVLMVALALAMSAGAVLAQSGTGEQRLDILVAYTDRLAEVDGDRKPFEDALLLERRLNAIFTNSSLGYTARVVAIVPFGRPDTADVDNLAWFDALMGDTNELFSLRDRYSADVSVVVRGPVDGYSLEVATPYSGGAPAEERARAVVVTDISSFFDEFSAMGVSYLLGARSESSASNWRPSAGAAPCTDTAIGIRYVGGPAATAMGAYSGYPLPRYSSPDWIAPDGTSCGNAATADNRSAVAEVLPVAVNYSARVSGSTLNLPTGQITVNEDDGQLVFTVSRIGSLAGEVRAIVAGVAGDGPVESRARPGVHFDGSLREVVFGDGIDQVQVSIPLIDDQNVNQARQFRLELRNIQGAADGVTTTAVTILDDETGGGGSTGGTGGGDSGGGGALGWLLFGPLLGMGLMRIRMKG